MGSPHLDDGVHLDGEAEGQLIDADGRTGVTTGVAEHLDHQVRAAVDDGGDGGEARSGLDKAAQLHDSHDAVQIAVQRGVQLGQQVDAAQTGAGVGLFRRDVLADRALETARGVVRQLARDVDEVSGADERHIVGHGRGGLGQGDAEFGQAGGDAHLRAPYRCFAGFSAGV